MPPGRSGWLDRDGGGVEELTVVVNHADEHVIGLDGNHSETRAGLGELGVNGILGGTHLRSGAGTKEIQSSGHEMLEIMVVAIEPGLNLEFVEQRQHAFNELGGVAMFAAGINGMMSDDNFPARPRGGESGLEPVELPRDVLGGHAGGGFAVAPVAFYHRRGIEVKKVGVGCFVDRMGLLEIPGGHVPAGMGASVLELGVAVAVIIVITEDDLPWDLEGRVTINLFKGTLPLGIARGGDAIFIEVVAERDDETGGGGFGGDGHLRGDLGLVAFRVASPVAKNEEIKTVAGRCG